MMSLFSSFDLALLAVSDLVYLFCLINLFSFYRTNSLLGKALKVPFSILMTFFFSLKPLGFSKFFMLSVLSTMSSVLFLNFFSVISYNFPLTSQISVVLFMGSSLWLCSIMFNSVANIKGLISHCIPEGTPIYLTWLLFMIELISNMIRPVTLTVRLAANILAGHLLMILLSEVALSSMLVSGLYLLLNIVEMFVALIQSYIFVTMIALYYSDVS